MLVASALSDAALVASALFAAVAAIASCIAIKQNAQIWKRSTEPRLNAQIIAFPKPPFGIAVVIHNSGTGLAKGAYFVLMRPGTEELAGGILGDGFIRPGETVNVRAEMLPEAHSKPVAVFFCRDQDENTLAWDSAGQMWRVPRRSRLGRWRRTVLDHEDIARHFHSDTRLDTYQIVPHTTTRGQLWASGL